MGPFLKAVAVRFFGQRDHTPDTPTDDELREAYEWATLGGSFPRPIRPKIVLRYLECPESVCATLRKLGAQ